MVVEFYNTYDEWVDYKSDYVMCLFSHGLVSISEFDSVRGRKKETLYPWPFWQEDLPRLKAESPYEVPRFCEDDPRRIAYWSRDPDWYALADDAEDAAE